MTTGGLTVLMLDKVLLSAYRKEPRGVEVFNLNLLRDLSRLGLNVSLALHESWRPVVEEWVPDGGVEFLVPPAGAGNLRIAVWLTRHLRKRRFGVLLLANVANRLFPALLLLRVFRVASRCTLIAHREPSRRNLYVQSLWPSTIVAVNAKIAGHFVRRGFPSVTVRYGITHADKFTPPSTPPIRDAVNFCVTGHLDSAWKGSDTAIAGFRALPENVRRRCRLHLASFHEPPTFEDPSIRAYAWMDFGKMPDFLRGMDVLIVPSRDEEVMRETFSQAMVQGMLTGLPSIVSDLPVLKEKLDKGGGVVFRDIGELTEAMKQLAEDPSLRQRLGREARDTALERYVWDTGLFVKDFLFPVNPS